MVCMVYTYHIDEGLRVGAGLATTAAALGADRLQTEDDHREATELPTIQGDLVVVELHTRELLKERPELLRHYLG